ncbi:MAG: hypothetical protein OXU85_00470, partial [Thaumarchaeota archaeon]|nr:hypothetical protein [Nitrososphaerota archaeon]MDD9842362.1 hypothetical protein [Nitrososphaerota archaeon]
AQASPLGGAHIPTFGMCGTRGKGVGKPVVGRRRAAAAARSAILSALIQIAFDLGGSARELRAMSRRKPGGRCLLSETMAIAVAVARDLSRHSWRRIAGSLAKAPGGACTVTHSQIWRRARKLEPDDVARYMRRRGIRMVRADDARIPFNLDRHGALTITAGRGGTVMTMGSWTPTGRSSAPAALRREAWCPARCA